MTLSLRLLLAGAVIVLLGAAGCTGNGTSEPAPTSAASQSPTAALPTGVTGATDVPTKVPNRPDWRSDVTLTACRSAKGGWEAGGTAHNPSDSRRVYRLTVFFTTTSATVIGVGHSSVSVPAGASRPWKVAGRFTAAPRTLCVLSGVG